jgi:hypothetical protein
MPLRVIRSCDLACKSPVSNIIPRSATNHGVIAIACAAALGPTAATCGFAVAKKGAGEKASSKFSVNAYLLS